MAPKTTTGEDDLEYTVLNLDRGSTIATRIRVAGTSSTRRKGLLGVSQLDEGSGIWIAPCESIHTFGMKMALDVLFLDCEYRVRKLVSNLVPNRVRICLRAGSVLELASGAIIRSRTQLGDRVAFHKRPMSSGVPCRHC